MTSSPVDEYWSLLAKRTTHRHLNTLKHMADFCVGAALVTVINGALLVILTAAVFAHYRAKAFPLSHGCF